MKIDRKQLRASIAEALERFRGVLLVGPRQVGKTTLARTFAAADSSNYFDLEDAAVAEAFRSPRSTRQLFDALI